jgi:hypothetical protein
MKSSIFDFFQARNDETLAIATKFPDSFAYMWHILEGVIKLHTPVLKLIRYLDWTSRKSHYLTPKTSKTFTLDIFQVGKGE